MKRNKITHSVVEIDDPIVGESSQSHVQVFESDSRWFNILLVIICLALLFLMGRVFYLSIVKNDYYAKIAEGNSMYSVPIIAPRGKIFDKNEEILAKNIPKQNVIIIPKNLPSEESEQKKIAELLDQKISLTYDQIIAKLKLASETGEISILAEDITHEESLIILGLQKSIPGITIQQTALREYVDGSFFSHIIGYEGLIQKEERDEHPDYLLTDRIGKTGIEYYYEKFLKGEHGATRSIVDSRGNLIQKLKDLPAKKGSDIHLNIDADLQRKLTESLKGQLDRAETKRATAIAMNPQTGEVLAMVSLPAYDNNLFAQGITSIDYNALINDEDRPLFNRAIGGVYPPGSTVKPVMAIATLAENIISADYQIESKGGLQLGSFFFGDWKIHGFTDMRRAIAVSSDVYFYTIGGGYGDITGLGIERMKEYMEKFGYGKKTNIDLPTEVSGAYPGKKWKEERIGERWYIGNTYHASIGQGYITSTPLQVLNSIAAIANGGTLFQPQIVSYAIDLQGNKTEFEPIILADNIAKSSEIKVAQEGMRQTVTDGTATYLKDLPVAVAGKTGTAQFGNKDQVHSWFVSYAPYEDPEIALIVMVENQTGEISSSTVPVAKEVYEWYFGER